MKRSYRSALWLVLALAGTWGCSGDADLISAPEEENPLVSAEGAEDGYRAAYQEAVFGEDRGRPTELISFRAAARIPGFGGLTFDTLGTMIVSLLDPNDPEAVGAVHRFLGPYHRSLKGRWGSGGQDRPVEIRSARYTFTELARWRDGLFFKALAAPSVVVLYVDQGTNRITIGVDPRAGNEGRQIVREASSLLGIPQDAVMFIDDPIICPYYVSDGSCEPDPREPPPPPEPPTSEVTTSDYWLNGYHRPVVAGLRFYNEHQGVYSTLGFSVQMGGAYYFAIAHHSTYRRAYVDGDVIHQDSWDLDRNRIGQETHDQAWHTVRFPYAVEWGAEGMVGTSGECSVDALCRRSDMALVRVDGGVDFEFARIAKPESRQLSPYLGGSLFVRGSDPYLYVRAEDTPHAGSEVDKVGQSTGWTSGHIEQVCVDYSAGGYPAKVYRCQTMADYYSQDGDSGAPVFYYLGGDDVSLLGLHAFRWGGYALFAPLANIRNDSGYYNYEIHAFKVVP